jgi:hypothetical protein
MQFLIEAKAEQTLGESTPVQHKRSPREKSRLRTLLE